MEYNWPSEWHRCPRTFRNPRRKRSEWDVVSGRLALLGRNSIDMVWRLRTLGMITAKRVGWAREREGNP